MASIVVEDGSTATLADDNITVDGGLGGAHAGQIFVANASSLTLTNLTVRFVNGTADGGIWVGASSVLTINASALDSETAARFAVTLAAGAHLNVLGSTVSGLQATEDITMAAIHMDAGAVLHAVGSTLRVRPDVRPLLDAVQATIDLTLCNLVGSLHLQQTTATLVAVTQRVIGDTVALDLSGSVVTVSNSTIVATGGASTGAAASATSVTIRSTNLTAEDIAVSAVGGSTVTLRDVVAQAGSDLSGPIGAFGLVAESASITGTNLAVIGFPTSLWLKNADAALLGAQLGDGTIRLNGSRASIDTSPALNGIVFVEALSTLTLTDTGVEWTKVDVAPPSELVPRYRANFRFFDASLAAASGANWSVFTASDVLVDNGTALADGSSVGPPLDGAHFRGTHFDAAPRYRIQMAYAATEMNQSITAWGPGLVFPFYFDPSLPDLAFTAAPAFSNPTPPEGSGFTVVATIALYGTASPVNAFVGLTVDGVPQALQSVSFTSASAYDATFNLSAQSGWHLVGIRVDLESSDRGVLSESNEAADNAVALWYNASTGNVTSVKPDLVITSSSLSFQLLNATGRDPVTGEPREARRLVVTLVVTNQGLTAATVFDVVVAAGVNSNRTTVNALASGATRTLNFTFGPYLDTQDIHILATVDVRDQVPEGNEENNRAEATAHIELPPYVPTPRPVWVTLLVVAAAGALVALSAWGVLLVFRRGENEIDAQSAATVTTPEKPATASAVEATTPALKSEPNAGLATTPAPPIQAPVAPPLRSPSLAAPLAPPPPSPVSPQPPPPPPQGYPPPLQQAMAPPPIPPGMAPPPGYSWQYPAYFSPPPQYRPYYPQQAPQPSPTGSRPAPPSPAAVPWTAESGPRAPVRCLKCGSSRVSYVLQPTRLVTCADCGAKDAF